MILWDGTFAPCPDQMNVVCVTHVDQALAVLAKWSARGPEPIVIAFAAAEMSLDIAKQIDRLAGTGTACVLSPPELSPEQTLVWLENEIGGVALHLEPPVDDTRLARIRVTVDAPPEIAEAMADDIREIVTRHGGKVQVKEWLERCYADESLD